MIFDPRTEDCLAGDPQDVVQLVVTRENLRRICRLMFRPGQHELFRVPTTSEDDLPTYALGVTDEAAGAVEAAGADEAYNAPTHSYLVRTKLLGLHEHLSVFAGPDAGRRALTGTLVMREDEAEAFRRVLARDDDLPPGWPEVEFD